jgi:hypothetical protein
MNSNQKVNILTFICMFTLWISLYVFLSKSSLPGSFTTNQKYGYTEASIIDIICEPVIPNLLPHCTIFVEFVSEKNQPVVSKIKILPHQLKNVNTVYISYELQNPSRAFLGKVPQEFVHTSQEQPEQNISNNNLILFVSGLLFIVSLFALLYMVHIDHIEKHHSIVYM